MSNQFTVPSALARRMRAAITILCVPMATGLAVWLGLELRASIKLNEQQNREIQELQADTRETRAAAGTPLTATGVNPAAGSATSANGSGFELLGANYWTPT